MAKGRDGKGKKAKETAGPDTAAAAPKTAAADSPAADGPAAGPAKPASGMPPALAVIAALFVIAALGYATRPYWLPALTGKPPATQAAKPAPKPASTTAPTTAPTPAPAPVAAAETVAKQPPKEAAAEAPSLQQLQGEREHMRAELRQLMARLDTVEKSLESARRMIQATAPPAEKLKGGLEPANLSDRLAAFEKSENALKELQQRVDKMEKGAGEATAQGAAARAVVLAVASLKDAVAKGEPYAKPLETLNAIAKDEPNIKATSALLAKHADKGVPTLAQLKDRFASIAGPIVQAAKAGTERGWMARAADRVAGLVTWRRVGDNAKPNTVDAAVARAETLLKAGDLTGAVKALDAVLANDKAAAVAEPWLADARARVAAERAVATLHLHAVSLLAPAKQ
jgi:hypothetical protein